MDALQTIVDLFSSMSTTLVAALFIVIALILIWLIVRASRRGSDATESVAKRAQPGRYHQEPAAHQNKSPAPRQAGNAETGAVVPEPVAISTVGEERREPESHALEEGGAVIPEPEDSILHRHYAAELAAKKEARAHPYPTDSVLRRHYDTLHTLHLDDSAPAVEAEPKPVASAAEQKNDTRKASTIEQAVKKDARISDTPAGTLQSGNKAAEIRLPQDSVLKRHFISQLQAEISASISPRPIDSVLRRHYDSMIQAELEKRLRG